MSRYVFLFAVGPVQSFIAEARRTADLFAGSHILAQISAAAADVLKPYELIFPHRDTLEDKEQRNGTPNKLVAVVDVPEGEDVGKFMAALADKAQKAAEKHWDDTAGQALLQLGLQDPKFHPLWERQKKEFLEFYWVAVPEKGDYMGAYKRANVVLDARKRTRLFAQKKEEELKDSLSGQRQALRTYSKTAEEFWAGIAQRPNERRVKEKERLDTIAAIKRFGVKSEAYPSVSTIASMDFVRDLSPEHKAALTKVIGEAGESFYPVEDFGRGFNYDGDLLYTATYSRLKDSYGEAAEKIDVTSIVRELKRVYQVTERVPTPYYAILAMDGDSMGKHLNSCQDLDEHKKMSQCLANFATGTKEIVEKHAGSLVYAGGDDVFGFFPLRNVLLAANELNEAFRATFQDWQQKDNEGNDFPFTMSAGIAIVHHLSPLDWALAEARGAEKVAKNKYGRNALVVRLLKRSGDSRQMGGRWDTVGMVAEIEEYFVNERLSGRLAHDLLAQAEVTTAVPLAHPATIKLMLKRHKDKKSWSETELTQLTGHLCHWVAEHDTIVPPQADIKQGLTELGRWLILARFIAQGGQDE